MDLLTDDEDNGNPVEIEMEPGLSSSAIPLEVILKHVELPEEVETKFQPTQVEVCLLQFLATSKNQTIKNDASAQINNSLPSLARSTGAVADAFRNIESTTEKLKGRRALEQAAKHLLAQSEAPSSFIATVLVVMVLALEDTGSDARSQHRAIASAVGAILSIHTTSQSVKGSPEQVLGHAMVRSLLQQAASTKVQIDNIDWHVISGLAKSVHLTCENDLKLAEAVNTVASHILDIENFPDDCSSVDLSEHVSNENAAACFALASNMGPWQVIKPSKLINIAVRLNLWHAADRICESATTSKTTSIEQSIEAVDTLLEAAFQSKQFRQADTYATKFFDVGGHRRFLEARYLHACSSIAKVIQKGALPVVDKQIERVDKAVDKMQNRTDLEQNVSAVASVTSIDPLTAKDDIRTFAIEQLEETGNVDAAHRLATIWEMEYIFDEEAILAAEKARREKYIQWEDYLAGSPPELTSDPQRLIATIEAFRRNESATTREAYGFDSEWNEENSVAVLQIGNARSVVLIDIPALSRTPEGVAALKSTVGKMFAECVMVGFSCQQDVSKLRSSSTCYSKEKGKSDNQHWFTECNGVVDLQTIVSSQDRSLGRLGLSRVCERYLGKPLDKSEQCSSWHARPLTLRQRVYAALDAWTVKVIYDKITTKKVETSSTVNGT